MKAFNLMWLYLRRKETYDAGAFGSPVTVLTNSALTFTWLKNTADVTPVERAQNNKVCVSFYDYKHWSHRSAVAQLRNYINLAFRRGILVHWRSCYADLILTFRHTVLPTDLGLRHTLSHTVCHHAAASTYKLDLLASQYFTLVHFTSTFYPWYECLRACLTSH